jgi:hypothetical protein
MHNYHCRNLTRKPGRQVILQVICVLAIRLSQNWVYNAVSWFLLAQSEDGSNFIRVTMIAVTIMQFLLNPWTVPNHELQTCGFCPAIEGEEVTNRYKKLYWEHKDKFSNHSFYNIAVCTWGAFLKLVDGIKYSQDSGHLPGSIGFVETQPHWSHKSLTVTPPS